MNAWTEVFKAVIDTGAAHRILLWGPPGTGKSSAPSRCYPGVPIFKVSVHEETAEEALIGHQIDIGTKGIIDGAAVCAMRVGGILVLDEIDKRHPSLDGVLHAVLDDLPLAQLTTRSGGVVKPKEGYVVVATTNAHPSELPEPILDRFDAIIHTDKPSPEAVAALKEDTKTLITRHYQNVKPANIKRGLSLRRAISFDSLRGKLGEELAASVVFGESSKEIISCLASTKV